MAYLRSAASRLAAPIVARAERPADLGRYAGATRGEVIGEVAGADAGRVRLALGGVRKLWGFLDLSARRELVVAADQLTVATAE